VTGHFYDTPQPILCDAVDLARVIEVYGVLGHRDVDAEAAAAASRLVLIVRQAYDAWAAGQQPGSDL
jgi:hypothetical protein